MIWFSIRRPFIKQVQCISRIGLFMSVGGGRGLRGFAKVQRLENGICRVGMHRGHVEIWSYADIRRHGGGFGSYSDNYTLYTGDHSLPHHVMEVRYYDLMTPNPEGPYGVEDQKNEYLVAPNSGLLIVIQLDQDGPILSIDHVVCCDVVFKLQATFDVNTIDGRIGIGGDILLHSFIDHLVYEHSFSKDAVIGLIKENFSLSHIKSIKENIDQNRRFKIRLGPASITRYVPSTLSLNDKDQKEENSMSVRLYKDGKALAIESDCQTEEAFKEQFCGLLADLIEKDTHEGEWPFHLRGWLTQYVEICNAYRGYKTDVTTRTVYVAGEIPTGEAFRSVDEVTGAVFTNGHPGLEAMTPA